MASFGSLVPRSNLYIFGVLKVPCPKKNEGQAGVHGLRSATGGSAHNSAYPLKLSLETGFTIPQMLFTNPKKALKGSETTMINFPWG